MSFYKEEAEQTTAQTEDHRIGRMKSTAWCDPRSLSPAPNPIRRAAYCDDRFDMYIVFTVPSEPALNVQLAPTVCDANGKTKAYPHEQPDLAATKRGTTNAMDHRRHQEDAGWGYGTCRVLISKKTSRGSLIYFKVRMDAGSRGRCLRTTRRRAVYTI